MVGILVALAEGRPAQLTRVLGSLSALPEADQARLGVVADGGRAPWPHLPPGGAHGPVGGPLAEKTGPDGQPSAALAGFSAALLEASVPERAKSAPTCLAVDWTDMESFACPPVPDVRPSADPEASWGHRRGHGPGQKDELFFGYYLSAATMVNDENGPALPELVRRATLSSCHVDPVPAFVPALEDLAASGAALGDVLADSGYAHRVAEHWALPLRAAGANIVTDLHPADRGPRGTLRRGHLRQRQPVLPGHAPGPARPGAPGPGRQSPEIAVHDQATAELAHYKLGRLGAEDKDGYHRVSCPAVMGKLRCPRRPASMTLSHERPTVLSPPEQPPAAVGKRP